MVSKDNPGVRCWGVATVSAQHPLLPKSDTTWLPSTFEVYDWLNAAIDAIIVWLHGQLPKYSVVDLTMSNAIVKLDSATSVRLPKPLPPTHAGSIQCISLFNVYISYTAAT